MPSNRYSLLTSKSPDRHADVKIELVAIAEITEMLGYRSRQGADYAIRHSEDFPKPLADLSAGRIWARSDVEEWMGKHPNQLTGRIDKRSTGKPSSVSKSDRVRSK
jgi:prophage regulatory protein